MKYKRAELTTQQIVLLIILLVSFAILLFFIYKLNFQELSEKQICQNSIQVKDKTSFFSEIDCKTNYICISGGDSCNNFNAKTNIKIDLSAKDGGKEQIMKVIADEMADCWWMFGEGKKDYVDWSLGGEIVCATCVEIAFDSKTLSKIEKITSEEFYAYLKNTKRNEVQTYWEYFYSSFKNFNPISSEINLEKIYGIYTGRSKSGIGLKLVPGGYTEKSIPPLILERSKSSSMGCYSFVTIP